MSSRVLKKVFASKVTLMNFEPIKNLENQLITQAI